jgi:hypothetical protein
MESGVGSLSAFSSPFPLLFPANFEEGPSSLKTLLHQRECRFAPLHPPTSTRAIVLCGVGPRTARSAARSGRGRGGKRLGNHKGRSRSVAVDARSQADTAWRAPLLPLLHPPDLVVRPAGLTVVGPARRIHASPPLNRGATPPRQHPATTIFPHTALLPSSLAPRSRALRSSAAYFSSLHFTTDKGESCLADRAIGSADEGTQGGNTTPIPQPLPRLYFARVTVRRPCARASRQPDSELRVSPSRPPRGTQSSSTPPRAITQVKHASNTPPPPLPPPTSSTVQNVLQDPRAHGASPRARRGPIQVRLLL